MTLRTYRGLKPQSEKAKVREKALNAARPRVHARDAYRCRLGLSPDCTGRAEDLHHVLPRSRGGWDEDENLLSACHACHMYAHNHPQIAREVGFIR